MTKALYLYNPRLLDRAVSRFGFDIHTSVKEENFRIFSKENLQLIFREYGDSSKLPDILSSREIKDIYFLDFGFGIGSEVRTGDIILPAFFFEYDRSVETLEEDREHFSGFAKDAVFLENYETQGDYDFGEFAMSIGGGAVSLGGENRPAKPLSPKISAAYGADVIDTESYTLAKTLTETYGFYSILCLKSDRSSETETIEEEARLAIQAVEIAKFLLESTSEEEFIQIAETGELETDEDDDYLTDEEHDE